MTFSDPDLIERLMQAVKACADDPNSYVHSNVIDEYDDLADGTSVHVHAEAGHGTLTRTTSEGTLEIRWTPTPQP